MSVKNILALSAGLALYSCSNPWNNLEVVAIDDVTGISEDRAYTARIRNSGDSVRKYKVVFTLEDQENVRQLNPNPEIYSLKPNRVGSTKILFIPKSESYGTLSARVEGTDGFSENVTKDDKMSIDL